MIFLLILTYIVSAYLCIFLQKKIYEQDEMLIPFFVAASFVPAFNTILVFALVFVYIEEANVGTRWAKKILSIKEDDYQ